MKDTHNPCICVECENLRRDAARYRWLRHGDNDDLVMRRCLGSPFVLRTGELDAVIDGYLSQPQDSPRD